MEINFRDEAFSSCVLLFWFLFLRGFFEVCGEAFKTWKLNVTNSIINENVFTKSCKTTICFEWTRIDMYAYINPQQHFLSTFVSIYWLVTIITNNNKYNLYKNESITFPMVRSKNIVLFYSVPFNEKTRNICNLQVRYILINSSCAISNVCSFCKACDKMHCCCCCCCFVVQTMWL